MATHKKHVKDFERGRLIAFEGIDRTGKTTQSQLLSQSLDSPLLMRFPDRSTETGKMLDQFLKSDHNCISKEMVHLIFSANRWEKQRLIKEALLEGRDVILDRYFLSGLAYSSSEGLELEWCACPDKGLLLPDFIFYMNCDLSLSTKREGFGEERYDNYEKQKKIKNIFEKELKPIFKDTWHDIPFKSKEEVKRMIEDTLKQPVKNKEIRFFNN